MQGSPIRVTDQLWGLLKVYVPVIVDNRRRSRYRGIISSSPAARSFSPTFEIKLPTTYMLLETPHSVINTGSVTSIRGLN